MKRTLIALVLAASFVGGWTWDQAHATPTVCHGHNSACTQNTATTAAAALTVTADTTTFSASGCQPGELVTLHLEYDTTGTATFNVDGFTNADANGAVNETLPVGSDTVTAAFGEPYTGASLTLTCGTLTFTAHT